MSMMPMKKLTVLTPLGYAESTVRRLMYLKCVEVRLTEIAEGDALRRYTGDTHKAEIESRLAEICKALETVGKYDPGKSLFGSKRPACDRNKFRESGDYDKAWGAVNEINQTVRRIAQCKSEAQTRYALKATVAPWRTYNENLSVCGTKQTTLLLGTLPLTADAATLNEILGELPAVAEFVSEDASSRYLSVLYHNSAERDVKRLLTEIGFLPAPVKNLSDTPDKIFSRAEAEALALDNEAKELSEKLITLGRWVPALKILSDIENTELKVAETREKLAETGRCAVIEGWVPVDSEKRLASMLDRMLAAYELEEPTEEDAPPVKLINNRFAQSFEWVVGMYSYPKYGTYDPTFIMGICYCVLFGFMFADLGYGLIMILAGFLAPKLLRMREGLTRTLNMFGYCGIASAVCGILFGGWFGDMPISILGADANGFFSGLWMNPTKDSLMFLIVSLGVGVVHLVIGMIIKFVILCKEGKVLTALFDIASWWFIFAGIGLFLLNTAVGLITAGIGVVTIVLTAGRSAKNPIVRLGKGLFGLYDIINYASDVLSYSRLLALGLAGSVIGSVINLIGNMIYTNTGKSFVGFIALVLIFVLGHLLNIAINVLGAFVHTSRLQYIEFFGKFFEDGGEKFTPVEPCDNLSDDLTPAETK